LSESAQPGRSVLPLRLEQVGLTVGSRAILQGVTAVLDAGVRTIILGANGAGKSVLLRICHGLLAPTTGTVRWNAEASLAARRQAMVFQRPVMLRRSAEANVAYALRLRKVPRLQRRPQARAALARVGLEALATHAARTMSVGEQQRLALGRAWALRPEVLFLDEPTASLDPGAINAIESIVEAMHAEGTKIVMVTHNLGQARRLGDEILFLHEGRLCERTPAERFFRRPDSAEAQRFLEGELPW
jgi:tungstate transport system ATP-binding protein